MPIDVTHLVAFLVGALSGAVGQYLADKYTDKRKKQESQRASSEQFMSIAALMPELIAEIKSDIALKGYETVRELVLLPSERVCFNSGGKLRFAYYESTHHDLVGKVQILEHEGYVIDVTPGNTPIYRMTEEFVDFLKRT